MIHRRSFGLCLLLAIPLSIHAGDDAPVGGSGGSGSISEIRPPAAGTLEFVDAIVRGDWAGVVSISLSPDQKHAYAAAFDSAAVLVFDRDAATGRLELIQTVADKNDLDGVTSIRLSPDGQYAVSAAFRSNTIVLYRRDRESGKLEVLDRARQSAPPVRAPAFFGGQPAADEGVGQPLGRTHGDDVFRVPAEDFSFVIEAVFAPNSRDLYALGCSSQTVVSFRVTDKHQLDLIEAIHSRDNCFANARGIVVTPDGKSLYVVAQRGNSLTALDREPATGQLAIKQICRDEEGGFHALQGAFSVTCDADADFLYVSSGNFGGDDAISVYGRDSDGSLSLVQELVNGDGQLRDFQGGNEIVVSPDGRNVYAVGTASSTLVGFRRKAASGKIMLIQTLRDQADGVVGLKDASGLAISSDGRYVYAVGDRSVSIFRRAAAETAAVP